MTYGIIRMCYISNFYFLLGLMDTTTGAIRGLGYSFVPMVITLMGACGLRILWIYTIFQIPKCHTLACLYQSYPISWIITFLVESIIFLIIIKRKENSENLLQQRSIA
jgi:Na+-driven multidrug efflux pump